MVDWLTKYVHFLAFTNPFIALTVTRDYMRHIYKLHEALESIVSDGDIIFFSNFWQELFKQMGTRLHLSIAYHPQIDR